MPEDISRPIEGVALIELKLRLPNQIVNVTNQVAHWEKSTICESVFESGNTALTFRVTNTQFLDSIMRALDSNGNPLVEFRWGLGLGSTVQWTPWQLHYVLKFQAGFEGIGTSLAHFFTLHTRDILHLIDRASKTQAHRGTVSSVVTKLARDNGLQNTVIEDTHGEGVWIQSYEGDWEFARQRLVARARSKTGRGNYYLYVRDNVLHFHTVEHQTTVKDFYYYGPSTGVRLEAIDLAQEKIEDGSAGVRVVYHDPYAGISKEIVSDPAKAIRFANNIPRLDKVFGAQRNIREHRIQIRDDEAGVGALAQNAYEYARCECFQLKLMTTKTPLLRPGEILRINVDPSANTTSVWSGPYMVASVRHIIDHGDIASVYILQRGELQVARVGAHSLAAYGVATIQDEQNAPGHELNVREAQSSTLTRGAGKTLNTGVYLTTQDKSKAPVPSPNVILPQ